MLAPWKESYDQPWQHIKKQRHYFVNNVPSNQGYDFSSGHVWMWEWDCEESWAPKNWCFWTVVLEKTLESPLDCKEIQSVHPKGLDVHWKGVHCSLSWVFIGRTVDEAETPIFWPPDAKSWLIWKDPDVGKDWRQEEKETTEDEMIRWHHWLNGHGFEWTLGVGDGQEGLVCCCSWGRQESDMTEWLNWTELSFEDSFAWGVFDGVLLWNQNPLEHSPCVCVCVCVCVLVAQSCPTFCDPMDCSPPGFFVHGILQPRVLECVVISFSSGSSQPRDRTWVSHIAGRFFTIWAYFLQSNKSQDRFFHRQLYVLYLIRLLSPSWVLLLFFIIFIILIVLFYNLFKLCYL